MADNVFAEQVTNPGTQFAFDDLSGDGSGPFVGRTKIMLGADGENDGDVSDANPMPVSLASVPSHAVTNAGTFAVQVSSALPAGANTIGAVNLAAGQSVEISASALPTGAATAAKQDTVIAALASIDSHVDGVEGSLTAIDAKITACNTGAVVIASSALPTGAATAARQDTGNASLSSIDAKLPALGQALAAASVPVVLTAAQLSTLTPLTTLPTVTTVDAVTQITNALPAGDNNIGNVDIVTMPNVTLAAGTNTNEVVGDAAHDAAIAGNPLRMAGRALTSDYTAVSTGDTADMITTVLGKQIVKLDSIPDNTWNYAAAAGGLVNTTGVTAKAAAGAGIRNYVKSCQVINSHATTGTEVLIRDGAAGTVLHRGWAQPGGGGYALTFDPPLRGSANTLIEIAEVTTTATAGVLVNLQGYSAAE